MGLGEDPQRFQNGGPIDLDCVCEGTASDVKFFDCSGIITLAAAASGSFSSRGVRYLM